MNIWGYSDLGNLLKKIPNLKNGIIVDTNILISATYELDKFNEVALDFIDLVIENKIPLYCNVNVRSEFLEIHRRILFSEAILDFEKDCQKDLLPSTLASMLTTYRNKYERRQKNNPDSPLRLSEAEIKEIKLEMLHVYGTKNNLWHELCEDRIGDKLVNIWLDTKSALNLNFLSLREEDQRLHLNEKPDWDGVSRLMSSHGVSSADAMILNMFFSSKFEAIATSDIDIALAVKTENRAGKVCILPDKAKSKITI
ncbi:MAG: hypothetical protein BroJett040_08240 [Oligoflexia bacterium]|nr:MAG: hypothetical protein BroJett040_08240 [Oligoflexia bacterium]